MWEGRAGGRFVFDAMLDVVVYVDRAGKHGLKAGGYGGVVVDS